MKPVPLKVPVTIVVIVTILLCSCRPGAYGKANEWIKGKALSAKVRITGAVLKGDPQVLMLYLRNDSDKVVAITPIRVVAWYGESGRLTMATTISPSGELLDSNVRLALNPHDDVGILLNEHGLNVPSPPTKVKVNVGPETSGEHEVFNISGK